MYCVWDAQGTLDCGKQTIEEFASETPRPPPPETPKPQYLEARVPEKAQHRQVKPAPSPPKAASYKTGR